MKEKRAELEAEVEQLLRRATELDEEEDRRYGKDRRGDELPEELTFREGRLRKIREAMADLRKRRLSQRVESPTRVRSATSPILSHKSCPNREVVSSRSRTTARRWWTAHVR